LKIKLKNWKISETQRTNPKIDRKKKDNSFNQVKLTLEETRIKQNEKKIIFLIAVKGNSTKFKQQKKKKKATREREQCFSMTSSCQFFST
jgi:leucyl aminopeptidase